jgi:phage-related minor tail protein
MNSYLNLTVYLDRPFHARETNHRLSRHCGFENRFFKLNGANENTRKARVYVSMNSSDKAAEKVAAAREQLDEQRAANALNPEDIRPALQIAVLGNEVFRKARRVGLAPTRSPRFLRVARARRSRPVCDSDRCIPIRTANPTIQSLEGAP